MNINNVPCPVCGCEMELQETRSSYADPDYGWVCTNEKCGSGSANYLFFDTETNGLPKNYKAPKTNLRNWPRIVQIAWVLYDNNGVQLAERSYIVKPGRFKIQDKAVAVHGITYEMAKKEGYPLKDVLSEFADMISLADILIAHNINFDEKVIGAEFIRTKIKNDLSKKDKVCTMLSSVEYCGLPGKYGGYKWPSLLELYYKLFGTDFRNQHDALEDVKACARCFFELKRIGVIKV